MTRYLGTLNLPILLALAAAACAPPAAPSPSPSPPQRIEATAAPAKPPPEAPAAKQPSAIEQKTREWEQVVAAARGEGQLIVYGPTGDAIAKALTEGFQRKFPGIDLLYSGLGSQQVITKLQNERNAGLYNADLFFGGASTALTSLIPANMLDPIPPLVVGPEMDASGWTDGKFRFADSGGKLFLNFASYVNSPIAYNPAMASPAEFSSYRELLGPKWKGNIVMNDPRVSGGPGGGIARFLYTEPELGKPYLQELLTSGVVLSRDERQVLDWVAQGRYPAALGPSVTTANELRSKGVRVELLPAGLIKEGSYLSPGVGGVGVIGRAPHPNAIKVYLDWVLSREAQLAFSQAVGYASRRLDVPRDHVDPTMIYQQGMKVRDIYTEAVVAQAAEIAAFLESILGR